MENLEPFWNYPRDSRKKDHFTKFHATVDKKTSFTFFKRKGITTLVIKKDLTEYDLKISASEAPIINQYLPEPEPFESILLDASILEKEIFPINFAIKSVFGEGKSMDLLLVRIALGSSESSYITVDETDLVDRGVTPTVDGLLDFIQTNQESIAGICDRLFETEKGNLILFDANLNKPSDGINHIHITMLSSLQQRGLFMHKKMKYAGVQLYITINAKTLTRRLVDFLAKIDIDLDQFFMQRGLALEEWIEIECEKNSYNLRNYLSSLYPHLSHTDINNIVKVAVKNKLNFKVVKMMGEMLDRDREGENLGIGTAQGRGRHYPYDPFHRTYPLKYEKIIAAARIACAYYGVKIDFTKEENIRMDEVLKFEQEFIKT